MTDVYITCVMKCCWESSNYLLISEKMKHVNIEVNYTVGFYICFIQVEMVYIFTRLSERLFTPIWRVIIDRADL